MIYNGRFQGTEHTYSDRMKTQVDNPFISPAAINLDEFSGTTKGQRDKWWQDFWKYLEAIDRVEFLYQGE